MFRRGQWVKLVAPIEVRRKVDGEEFVATVPAGALGIHHPLDCTGPQHDRTYLTPNGAIKGSGLITKNPLLVGFHQVDPEHGFETIREMAVLPKALRAVTSREEIPAARLATMRVDWTPEA